MNKMLYNALHYGTSLVHPSRQNWLIEPSLVDKKKKSTVKNTALWYIIGLRKGGRERLSVRII
jgi:hypothetical protein